MRLLFCGRFSRRLMPSKTSSITVAERTKRAQRMRVARREIIWAVLGFVLIQFVAAVNLECWLLNFRDLHFAFKQKQLQQLVAASPNRPLALAMGSSRFLMGLDAELLNRREGNAWLIFNMGFDGNGCLMNRIYLRRLREEGMRPDILFLDFVPCQLLASDDAPMEDSKFEGERLRLDELALIHPGAIDPEPMFRRWALGRGLPCIQYGERVCRRWSIDRRVDGIPHDMASHGIDRYGFRAGRTALAPGQAAEKSICVLDCFRPQFQNARVSPVKLQALRNLLGDCRRDAIPTALILMPEAFSFREMYPAGLNEELEHILRMLKREFDLLAVVDARKWVDDERFVDPHHLNVAGARLFTERFDAEVFRPLTRSPSKNGAIASR